MKRSLFLIALLFFSMHIASAQIGGGVGEDLTVRLTPEHPRAGETVSIEIESFVVDLNTARISWTVNGQVKRQSIGEKRFRAVVGGIGSTTGVHVAAELPDGRIFEHDIALRPANVELLWQTNGYTPPFYKGKALFPYQGTALLAALPHFANEEGALLKAGDLIYTWSEDEKIDGDSSGYGKQLYAVQGTVPIRPKTVSVEVRTADRSLVASASTVILPVQPRLVLYENHPLYGLRFSKALGGTFSLMQEEAQISVVPYYFEIPTRDHQALSYIWSLNFKPIEGETSADLVLRRTSEKGGRATLGLEAQHDASKSFQAGRIGLSIRMEQNPFRSLAPASQ